MTVPPEEREQVERLIERLIARLRKQAPKAPPAIDRRGR